MAQRLQKENKKKQHKPANHPQPANTTQKEQDHHTTAQEKTTTEQPKRKPPQNNPGEDDRGRAHLQPKCLTQFGVPRLRA
jgi:hypothetical protein